MKLKAIVFKTSRLKETRDFFDLVLGIQIKEFSGIHFVIHHGDIRILFVESEKDFETELYFSIKDFPQLIIYEDPNQIKVIAVYER